MISDFHDCSRYLGKREDAHHVSFREHEPRNSDAAPPSIIAAQAYAVNSYIEHGHRASAVLSVRDGASGARGAREKEREEGGDGCCCRTLCSVRVCRRRWRRLLLLLLERDVANTTRRPPVLVL